MISTFSSNWFEGIRKEIHFINNEFVEKIFVKNSNKCKMIFGKNENEEKEEKKYLNFLRRNLCPFFNLCSAMISSSLNEIQFENLIKFQLKDVIFQTNLHLSDFDGLSIDSKLEIWSFVSLFCQFEENRMLRYLPSCEDYFESFQIILRQIQNLFVEQWKSSFDFDTSIRDLQRFRQNLKEEKFVRSIDRFLTLFFVI